MNLFTYLKSLLPIIRKDTILENLRITRGAYSSTAATLVPVADILRKHTFKDPAIISYNTSYMRGVDTKGAKNMIVHAAQSIPNIMANIELIERYVEGNIEESIAIDAATFKHANIVQLCDAVDFCLNFIVTFTNYTMVSEVNAARAKSGEGEQIELPAPVIENLQKHFADFVRVMNIFTREVSDVEKRLTEIPDVLVPDANYSKLAKTMGKTNVDPLNLEQVNFFNGSPFQAIGKWRAERENAKYRMAQETLQCLKMRRMQLEKALDGKQDAGLERQLRATQSRIDELARKLEEMDNAG